MRGFLVKTTAEMSKSKHWGVGLSSLVELRPGGRGRGRGGGGMPQWWPGGVKHVTEVAGFASPYVLELKKVNTCLEPIGSCC